MSDEDLHLLFCMLVTCSPGSVIINFVVTFFGGEEVDVLLLNADVNQAFQDGFFGPDVMNDPLFTSHKSKKAFLSYRLYRDYVCFILNQVQDLRFANCSLMF